MTFERQMARAEAVVREHGQLVIAPKCPPREDVTLAGAPVRFTDEAKPVVPAPVTTEAWFARMMLQAEAAERSRERKVRMLIAAGAATINEIRSLYGLPPLADGDRLCNSTSEPLREDVGASNQDGNDGAPPIPHGMVAVAPPGATISPLPHAAWNRTLERLPPERQTVLLCASKYVQRVGFGYRVGDEWVMCDGARCHVQAMLWWAAVKPPEEAP